MLTVEQIEVLTRTSRPKLEAMRAALSKRGSALVAFSGGVDSTFVLKIAAEVFGDNAVALTALSASVAAEEKAEAQILAEQIGVRWISLDSREVEDPRYAANPTNRCYFCKTELYDLCEKKRTELGLDVILDGFNADDFKDHRPGHQAAKEHHVVSPLADAGLTKLEIRAWSQQLGLPTWDKPQMACLASRIPFGTSVTSDRLLQIGAAESAVRVLGLRSFRVRYHGDIARLEVAAEEYENAQTPSFRAAVNTALKAIGFTFVVLDVEPFRSGRLSEAAGLTPSPGAQAGPSPDRLSLPVLR